MVGGPAHGPRVDVVQLAACTRARRALVALAILKQLLLAISPRRRDGAVVSRRDERQNLITVTISASQSLCSIGYSLPNWFALPQYRFFLKNDHIFLTATGFF